ncbi:MAG: hypothetical protein CMJ46_02140 [Planctomyces sp.]|nr:hypothetical protein [Planctomyces sp.]
MDIANRHRMGGRLFTDSDVPAGVRVVDDRAAVFSAGALSCGNFRPKPYRQDASELRQKLERKHPDWSAAKLDRAITQKLIQAGHKQPLPRTAGYYPELETYRLFLHELCAREPVQLLLEHIDFPPDWDRVTSSRIDIPLAAVDREYLYRFPINQLIRVSP